MNREISWVASLHTVALAAGIVMVSALVSVLHFAKDKPLAQQHAGRANAWRGIPGCVVMAAPTARASGQSKLLLDPVVLPLDGKSTAHCQGQAGRQLAVAALETVPPGIEGLRLAIDAVRSPPGVVEASRAASSGTATAKVAHAGRVIAQGSRVHLTIQPTEQRSAQAVADCVTGNTAACGPIQLDLSPWKDYYETAAVRMIGLLVMDAESGEIEALGSAMSPCFKALHSGAASLPECPPMPTPPAHRPYRLSNRALHAEAMPASMDKPILTLALLRAPPAYRPSDEQLRDMLRRSDSEAFLDALFCKSHGFSDCGNAARAVQAARDLSWNIGCARPAVPSTSIDCAKLQPFLMTNARATTQIHGARIFHQLANVRNQGPEQHAINIWQAVATGYPATLARECASRKWHRCDGADFASLSAEAWGQGNALASPAGIAAMFSRLAVSARHPGTQEPPPLPHLVVGAPDASKRSRNAPAADFRPIDPQHATLILDGLARTHRAGGTANGACIHVFGSVSACEKIDWLHGKTGTPVFVHERLSAAARVAHCQQLAGQIGAHQGNTEAKRKLVALHSHCAMAPYKWYAALVKYGSDSKVVVALVERNYTARTGLVDSVRDRGANLAAVAALTWTKQWREQQSADVGEGI